MKTRPDPICILVADDLTGACDAGVQFALHGFSTTVVLDPASAPECTADVVAVSTESRADSAQEASSKVRTLGALLHGDRTPWIFKKIDSTLRGNVAPEIEASMQAFACSLAVIAPAFPAMGRTVCGGWLRVANGSQGAPIHVPTLLEQQGLRGLVHCDLAGGSELLRRTLEDRCAKGIRFILMDSNSEEDLKVVTEAAFDLKGKVLWVGSAGLAMAVARILAHKYERVASGASDSGLPREAAGPVVLCIGSDHPVTLEQQQFLLANRPVAPLTVDRKNLAYARQTLREKHHLVISIEQSRTSESSLRDFFSGLEGSYIHALLLSGGDTATLACRALGAKSISLQAEIMTGIPWGRLIGGLADDLPVATKAGGFGGRDALVTSLDFLGRSGGPGTPPVNVSDKTLPTIAITIGDPAGIGPEVVLKALSDPEIADLARWIIVGDARVLEQAGKVCGIFPSTLKNAIIRDLKALGTAPDFTFGRLSAACGLAAVEYVREAVQLCLRGEADAMVTAPLNKEAVTLSRKSFSGHTELIAELCDVKEPRMMLANDRLCVVHVSTHVSLRQACQLDSERILRTIELGNEALKLLGFERPRIAVCGLNPHAGEHGVFGDEEMKIIRPAVEVARDREIQCDGPFAPDTIFLRASRGAHDLVVTMYHDQGHIPMKLLDFERTVNVTLGIPIIRTSVDHGTAFDIAGQNKADARNMKAALRMGAAMAVRKLQRKSKDTVTTANHSGARGKAESR